MEADSIAFVSGDVKSLDCIGLTKETPVPHPDVTDLTVGTRGTPGLLIDEVLILRRALTADEIAGYCTAIRQMREAGYPAH